VESIVKVLTRTDIPVDRFQECLQSLEDIFTGELTTNEAYVYVALVFEVFPKFVNNQERSRNENSVSINISVKGYKCKDFFTYGQIATTF